MDAPKGDGFRSFYFRYSESYPRQPPTLGPCTFVKDVLIRVLRSGDLIYPSISSGYVHGAWPSNTCSTSGTACFSLLAMTIDWISGQP